MKFSLFISMVLAGICFFQPNTEGKIVAQPSVKLENKLLNSSPIQKKISEPSAQNLLLKSKAKSLNHSIPSSLANRANGSRKDLKLRSIPEKVELKGLLSNTQLIILGKNEQGIEQEINSLVAFRSDDSSKLEVDRNGRVIAKKDGSGKLIVEYEGTRLEIPYLVQDQTKPRKISFRDEVIPSLNVAGCNMGACHGTPSGKNGFRLSLRGYDPASDLIQLSRDMYGRRIDTLHPIDSLVMQKALGRVPHEGGARFGLESIPASTIVHWIQQNMPDDSANHPKLISLDVIPGSRIVYAPIKKQQIKVIACFSNQDKKDVTPLTVFSSSDSAIAEVNSDGTVQFKQPGEIAILVRYQMMMKSIRLTWLEPKSEFVWSNPKPYNFIDEKIFPRLQRMNINPSSDANDNEWLRRIYLDICGRLPTPVEIRSFSLEKSALKRQHKIDELLRSPEFFDFWTMKWEDLLRANRKMIQYKGTTTFQKWLYNQFAENRPVDVWVRELLTAQGNCFNNPATNYYRVVRGPEALAETIAQLFLGVRLQCAKCHNHPFERWTQDDYYGFAAWFVRVRQKNDPRNNHSLFSKMEARFPTMVYSVREGEMIQPRTNHTMPPTYLGGSAPKIDADLDRRNSLADWITSSTNPFFARSIVNRTWFHLFGKGIVDPVDDFRESNPSSNDELLDALADHFVKHHYDLRDLIQTILSSHTYQLSAELNDSNRDDQKLFSHYYTKLMSAEQLLDAICDITQIPEKFTGLPIGTRAIQLPDGEIHHPFLKTFGQPARELACECERETDSNLSQALQLINGTTLHEKLAAPNNRIGQLLLAKKTDSEILEELYLSTLSRLPTSKEREAALKQLKESDSLRHAWEDILWALINTREFLFRH